MTTSKLVVLAAFRKTDEGELVPAFEPRLVDTEERALREARLMASHYAGVLAWSRDADPTLGDYGPPSILFQAGEIPVME
ncbi:hypothetical protein [Sinorhizobium sp. RAC02]|uniref:hypothetical protein n=1 Tax=Sinorhizobium sp. RAC02 TaxID=1842534 RepID=UPI00083DDA6C|nr:hypothetical protein [Sinorhizobium sp. RAC02]AOF90376.1 hypothetical protein BSY16_32 [Sinorhizobium sp. RAC02]